VEEDEGRELPWFQCPEAVMGHSTKLTEVILSKISHELKDLAKWMSTWDKQVANKDIRRLWERGQKGQCRQSAHSDVCHPWDPSTEGNRPKFKNQERLVAAKFYGAIIEWAASKDRGLEFWKSSSDERPTIILRAIRAVWKKEKCQMDVLYEHEKNLETTYYIPASLFTCMQEHFPILMWAEMFRVSPNFAHFHGPPKVLVAIELCLQGHKSPWKAAHDAIENGQQAGNLALTNEPHQDKGPSGGSGKDKKSRTTSWSSRPTPQEWPTKDESWEGWIPYSSDQGSKPGWWSTSNEGAFSHEARSNTSEASSRETRFNAGYGKSKSSSCTVQEWWDADEPPPWRKR